MRGGPDWVDLPASHAAGRGKSFGPSALPQKVFAGVLDLINGLRGPPGKAVPV